MASNNQPVTRVVKDEVTQMYEEFDRSVRKAKEAVDFLLLQTERVQTDMKLLKTKLDDMRIKAADLQTHYEERNRRG